MTMKIHSLRLLLVTATSLAVVCRADQQQQQQQYYNNNNAAYAYENYEDYQRSVMSQRSLSVTGCATTPASGGAAPKSYITFRLCDKSTCSSSSSCSSADYGDYSIPLQTFVETYGEYVREAYGDNNGGQQNNGFECMRAEEYMENMYQQQGGQNNNYNNNYQNNNNNYYYNNQNQNNQNNNNNGQEWYIGPSCSSDGKSIQYAVYYDEECTYSASSVVTLQDITGGSSSSSTSLTPKSCISCVVNNNNNNYYYNNNNQGGGEEEEAELIPLCDEMMEYASRCDRKDGQSDYDQFVQVMMAANSNYAYNNNNNNNGGNENNAAAAYSASTMTYYVSSQNERVCSFIDSLWSGKWDGSGSSSSKARSRNSNSDAAFKAFLILSVIAVVGIILGAGYFAGYYLSGLCCESRDAREPFILPSTTTSFPYFSSKSSNKKDPDAPTSSSSSSRPPSSRKALLLADTKKAVRDAGEKPSSQFSIESGSDDGEPSPPTMT